MMTVYKNSIIAGFCASLASFWIKLSSFSASNYFYSTCICIILMIISNFLMWLFYTNALKSSKNSITPVLISTSINLICTEILGCTYFNEIPTYLELIGSSFLFIGVILLTSNNNKVNHDKEDIKES